MQEIIKILKNYKFVKKEFYFYFIFAILSQVSISLTPLFYKKIVFVIENGLSAQDLYHWCLLTFFLVLFFVFTELFFDYLGGYLQQSYRIKKFIIYRDNIINSDYEKIINEGTGKIITKVERGLDSESLIFMSILHIISKGIIRTLIVLVILYFSIPILPFIFLFFLVLIIFLAKFLYKFAKPLEDELSSRFESNTSIFIKIIMENILVKIFNKKDFELNLSNKILSKIPLLEFKSTFLTEVHFNLIYLFIKITELGVYFFIGLKILEGTLSFSEIILAISGITLIWFSAESLVNRIGLISKNLPKYYRLKEFIEIKNNIQNGTKIFQFKNGKIELKNLNFSYSSEKNIFKNLNLEFLEGKKNALVGHSGGGKSTITKILLRLYDYQKGEVLVDGQDLRDLKIETFYDKIGYLPQEPAVFDGTIRENLEYAFSENFDLSEKEKEKLIWDSLEKSKISEMVKKLEKGLDTEIGEKGVKLSGGEKQRLAIARIFLKNPEIIILDEPTSALDSISEAGITESLNELMKGKTSIVIAHRLQTVMNSDKIFVIEDGKIKDSGNHNELLENSEIYKKLVDLQNGKIIE